MTGAADSRLTRACRAVLRGESPDAPQLRSHVDSCAFCAEWLRRRVALQQQLLRPVPPPSELESAKMLAGIRERIVDQCEHGPFGRVLEDVMPVPSVGDEGRVWPEQLLASELASRLEIDPGAAPQARDWEAVRSAVLHDIADSRADRIRLRRSATRQRALAAVGAAAILTLSLMMLRGRELAEDAPVIQFADIPSLPDVGFSPMDVLRNGGDD